MAERHSICQKIWWWVVTLYLLTRDIDQVIQRLEARQVCAKGSCGLRELPSKADDDRLG